LNVALLIKTPCRSVDFLMAFFRDGAELVRDRVVLTDWVVNPVESESDEYNCGILLPWHEAGASLML